VEPWGSGAPKSLRCLHSVALSERKRYADSVRYTVLHFLLAEDRRFHMQVGADGFPDWVVEVVLMLSSSGPAITDLLIYPRRDEGWTKTRRTGADGLPLPTEPTFGPSLAEQSEGISPYGPWARPMRATPWSANPDDIPPGGIPGRLMRAINPGQLLELARPLAKDLASNFDLPRRDDDPYIAAHYRKIADLSRSVAEPAKRTGRRGNGVDHYLGWAVRYAEKGGAPHPIKELAEEHAMQYGIEYGQAHNYVRDTITDARRRYGLLEKPPGQGLSGGTLTQKALDLIRESAKKEKADGK
jgi:hypothetical protein